MPRPITKEDTKRWRGRIRFRTYTHEVLGIYIVGSADNGYKCYAYSTNIKDRYPFWVTKTTLKKRMKIGFPKPRRTPRMMRDIGMFTYDEIDAAMKVMEQMEGK